MLKFLLTSLFIHQTLSNTIHKRDVGDFEFLILHNNDMHARFEETRESLGGRLVGGFARTSYLIQEARNASNEGRGPPVLYLNAGDTYTGTVWFTVHKDKIATDFMNALMPDAMSFGNHEFDNGVKGVIPFLENIKFPLIASNLDLSKEPQLKNLVQKSIILNLHGRKIGIIGYVTPETRLMSSVGSIGFNDEIQSVRKEAERLTKEGINIIIALGHSGFKMDKKIAKEVKEVDIVIGGHTNTFLWNGVEPDKEKAEDAYPAEVVQKSGKIVPVVQAYAYTKYLGKLSVNFDRNGVLKTFRGQPIFIDESVPQDPQVLKLLDKYRPDIIALNTTMIGKTKVFLEGDTCRERECNFGNLAMDAFINYRSSRYQGLYWTDTAIALMNSGSIRQSINSTLRDHQVYKADILGSLPFGQLLYLIELKGEDLLKSLEIGARSNGETSKGEFLLTSGLKVEYNFKKPVGNRVISVKVRCAACDVPSYSPISKNEYYRIITTLFLVKGGDGHSIIRDKPRNYIPLDAVEAEAVIEYFQTVNVVTPELDERTRIVMGSSKGVKFDYNLFVVVIGLVLNCF
ncbi:protein 5NUC-like [Onthophagus taurus]|uniref:protein 5NUC-like n=1 Tax=Onthophagus taurus TaxID=166361 RepID=UPI0039BE8F03